MIQIFPSKKSMRSDPYEFKDTNFAQFDLIATDTRYDVIKREWLIVGPGYSALIPFKFKLIGEENNNYYTTGRKNLVLSLPHASVERVYQENQSTLKLHKEGKKK